MEWLNRLRYKLGMWFFGKRIMRRAYKMTLGDAIDSLLEELENPDNAFAKLSHSRYSHQLYDMFIKTPFLLTLLIDVKTNILDCSSTWMKYAGWSKEEMLDKTFLDLLHPDDKNRTIAGHKNVEDLDTSSVFENRYLCRNETRYSYEENGEHWIWVEWQVNVDYKNDDTHRICVARVVNPNTPKFNFLQEQYSNDKKTPALTPA